MMAKANQPDSETGAGEIQLQLRDRAELATAVAAHCRRRSRHPVPVGWTEDSSGLLAAPGERARGYEPDPWVVLSTRWRGKSRSATISPARPSVSRRSRNNLWVYVDYYFRGHVNVTFSDWSGRGLTAGEVKGLMFDLLRLDVPTPLVAAAVKGAARLDGWYFDLLLPDPLPADHGWWKSGRRG